MGREHGVLGQLGADAEPPRRDLQAGRGLTLRVAPLDPAEEREGADEGHEPRLELPGCPGEQRRDDRRRREHREYRSPDGLAREAACLCVGHDAGDEAAHPPRRLVLRPGREGLGRDDAVARARQKVVEHAALVPGQRLVVRGPKPHVEDTRPALLDVDDVASGQIDERGRNGIVGHAEPVREEVHNRRRLGAELHRPSGRPAAAAVSARAGPPRPQPASRRRRRRRRARERDRIRRAGGNRVRRSGRGATRP